MRMRDAGRAGAPTRSRMIRIEADGPRDAQNANARDCSRNAEAARGEAQGRSELCEPMIDVFVLGGGRGNSIFGRGVAVARRE